MKWLWFIVVQLIAFALMVIGWVLLVPLCAFRVWTLVNGKYHFPVVFAPWDNREDGVMPLWYNPQRTRWRAYLWAAWRNSVNNLRYVFMWKGGPFYQWRGGGYYFQAGWRPDNGWPVLSAGKGGGTQI